jgi:hypothetical protein
LKRVLSALAILLTLPVAIRAETPVFSVERNLVVFQQAMRRSFDFREDLAPLDPVMADACCTVKPGQPITLVRGSQVVGIGVVDAIIAGLVRRAGGDELVYFTVTGMPDSLTIDSGPPMGLRTRAGYDLYIAATTPVTVLPLPAESWSDPDTFNSVMHQLFADDVLAGPRTMVGGAIDVRGYEGTRILASVPAQGAWCLDFACITAPAWAKSINLRGKLDRLLEVNGVVYVVMVDCLPGTGAWGFWIQEVRPDGSVLEVHTDTSWST